MSIKDDAQRAHKNLLGETESDTIDNSLKASLIPTE